MSLSAVEEGVALRVRGQRPRHSMDRVSVKTRGFRSLGTLFRN
jgi:hypothetical protein